MGNPKQKWTSEEEEALRAGVAKHGTGKWKNIQKDPEFNHFLYSRSNIDLKDKWRNMTCANGTGSREKSRTPKAKANTDAPNTPLPLALPPPAATTSIPTSMAASSTPVIAPQTTDASTFISLTPDTATTKTTSTTTIVMVDDYSKCVLDGKTASKYNALIYEALSTLKDPNGSDTSAIANFIEKRIVAPPNFRRLLSTRLRRLVAQDKLEKVQNFYRMKKNMGQGRKTAFSKSNEIRDRPAQTKANAGGDSIQEAAVQAAYKIAEAENKSYVAAEVVKEAERVSKMAEDAEAMLELAKEIYERCSRGEIVYVN